MNKQLYEHSKRIKQYIGVLATLQWDEEVCLPEKGLDERAQQTALIATLLHEECIGSKSEDIFAEFESTEENPIGNAEPHSDDAALLRALYRDYTQEKRIPHAFVKKETLEIAKSFRLWRKARVAGDGGIFLPQLERIVELMREKAEYLGYKEDPYDALLDLYAPGMKSREVDVLFEELIPTLKTIRNACLAAEQPPFPHEEYRISDDMQMKIGNTILDILGYPRDRGRLDISAHPFSTTLGSNDVRVTTRYDSFVNSLLSCAHEFGHALYELQIDKKWHETTLSDGTSLSIHESQSRTWENLICRSHAFWRYWYPQFLKLVPTYKDVPLDVFWKRLNRVGNDYVRIESDEVSYNLHIVLRYRLERAMIAGNLAVKDVPDAWKDTAFDLLGHRPPNDTKGFLQDIHWSHGSFGYFSTYALGNLIAAQFFGVMKRDIPGYEKQIENGDFATIRSWQKEKIHTHGRALTTEELLETVVGSGIQTTAFIAYVKEKYSAIYGIDI